MKKDIRYEAISPGLFELVVNPERRGEIRKVHVLAEVSGYAMVRRHGCSPYVTRTIRLFGTALDALRALEAEAAHRDARKAKAAKKGAEAIKLDNDMIDCGFPKHDDPDCLIAFAEALRMETDAADVFMNWLHDHHDYLLLGGAKRKRAKRKGARKR